MTFPSGIAVVRLRASTETDGYGNDRRDWSDPDELTIDGCALAPRVEEEAHERGREGVRYAWTLYCPYDADILPNDRVRHPDGTFEVEGPVQPWRSPFTGRQSGATVHLRRVEG